MSNVCVVGVPEGEERQKEMMARCSPSLAKDINLEVQEVLKTKQDKYNKNIPRHIIFKLLKAKAKKTTLKAIWGKQNFTYRGIMI